MSLKYPNESSVDVHHRAFVISMGGASGVSTGDKIIDLSMHICEDWNLANPTRKALYATGVGSLFDTSRGITEKICEVCGWIQNKSGALPKLVLIGKSLGGCKLYNVANRLADEGVEIDLFVGVDISCHIARHYDNYLRFGIDELVFPNNIKLLINFYQHKKSDFQCGHVAIWDAPGQCRRAGPRAMCKDYNIDVNHDLVYVDSNGDLVFGGTNTICTPEVGHLDIDSDQNLLDSITKIVKCRVL